MKKFLLVIMILSSLSNCPELSACTSMIVGRQASDSGRPLLWKHRDTGAPGNFLAHVEAAPDEGRPYAYIGLFNDGDSLLREAWMGMNDAGFAIMNTASYNLAPDTTDYKDREALVMSAALGRCRSVDDFERLLQELPKPLGVQANFGVIDSEGNGAYFETDDHRFKRFDLGDEGENVLVRTNFSVSGAEDEGYGYLRYQTVMDALDARDSTTLIGPEFLTEELSRSFSHPLLGSPLEDGRRWVTDKDFIPRTISTSSIVIEGIMPGEDADSLVMWAVLGYPPCGHVERVTMSEIPAGVSANAEWKSDNCVEAMRLRDAVHPIRRGSGPDYIDLRLLLPIMNEQKALSSDTYGKYRK